MSDWYRWDRKTDRVEKIDDLLEAAREFETADRVVAQDDVGDLRVSTVFLSVAHGWGDVPDLFETMVFLIPHIVDESGWDNFQWRYHTAQEARQGHQRLLAYIQAGGKPDEWQ